MFQNTVTNDQSAHRRGSSGPPSFRRAPGAPLGLTWDVPVGGTTLGAADAPKSSFNDQFPHGSDSQGGSACPWGSFRGASVGGTTLGAGNAHQTFQNDHFAHRW